MVQLKWLHGAGPRGLLEVLPLLLLLYAMDGGLLICIPDCSQVLGKYSILGYLGYAAPLTAQKLVLLSWVSLLERHRFCSQTSPTNARLQTAFPLCSDAILGSSLLPPSRSGIPHSEPSERGSLNPEP